MNQELTTKKVNLKKALNSFAKKTVPMYLVIAITFNSTLVVGVLQHIYYMKQIKELIAYKENSTNNESLSKEELLELESRMFPEGGIILPVKWNDLGKKLVDTGVIDQEKFLELFKSGPISGVDDNYTKILSENVDEYIVLTKENSRFVLNTLWALGLAQQSLTLDEMQANYPNDVANLASTGGWTIGETDAMEYYSKHNIFDLNREQQELVKKIAATIYRPCCDNHTAFADCNHGMAMLGLIEMMVSKGFNEDQIYASALAVNAMWFPDTYLTIAQYLKEEYGVEWENVDTRQVLSSSFSSSTGYNALLTKISPVEGSRSGGGCGV